MSKVLVVGCGVSGRAVIDFCLNREDEVVCVDRHIDNKVPCSIFPEDYFFAHFDFDLVVISPGVRLNHPQVKRAYESGVEVIGEVELALKQISNQCVGITGTNGKSTVVSLIAHVLNSAGKKAHAVGNIGFPIISMVSKIMPEDILVVELSSFQLMTMHKKSLDIGVILNITPDHLDWHGSFEAYKRAKLRIKELLKEGGVFLYPIENFDCATKVCLHFGCSQEEIKKAFSTYNRLEHRMEYVGEVNGVRCINNSKATNIGSLEHALNHTKGEIVLICGGVNKGVSMQPLASMIEKKCRFVVLIGQSKEQIASELTKNTPHAFAETMDEAVEKGLQQAARGDTLMLAPGCASLDMFDNYKMRGKVFKQSVAKGHRDES